MAVPRAVLTHADLAPFYHLPPSATAATSSVPPGTGAPASGEPNTESPQAVNPGPGPVSAAVNHNLTLDSKVVFRLGSVDLQMGNYNEAIASFNLALALKQAAVGETKLQLG